MFCWPYCPKLRFYLGIFRILLPFIQKIIHNLLQSPAPSLCVSYLSTPLAAAVEDTKENRYINTVRTAPKSPLSSSCLAVLKEFLNFRVCENTWDDEGWEREAQDDKYIKMHPNKCMTAFKLFSMGEKVHSQRVTSTYCGPEYS